jgi:hypothetical protein
MPSAPHGQRCRALADLNRKNTGIGKPELKTRIGLETGPVVVDLRDDLAPHCEAETAHVIQNFGLNPKVAFKQHLVGCVSVWVRRRRLLRRLGL